MRVYLCKLMSTYISIYMYIYCICKQVPRPNSQRYRRQDPTSKQLRGFTLALFGADGTPRFLVSLYETFARLLCIPGQNLPNNYPGLRFVEFLNQPPAVSERPITSKLDSTNSVIFEGCKSSSCEGISRAGKRGALKKHTNELRGPSNYPQTSWNCKSQLFEVG